MLVCMAIRFARARASRLDDTFCDKDTEDSYERPRDFAEALGSEAAVVKMDRTRAHPKVTTEDSRILNRFLMKSAMFSIAKLRRSCHGSPVPLNWRIDPSSFLGYDSAGVS